MQGTGNLRCNEQICHAQNTENRVDNWGQAGVDCHVEDGAVRLAKDREVHQGEDGADCHVEDGAVHLAKDRAVYQG